MYVVRGSNLTYMKHEIHVWFSEYHAATALDMFPLAGRVFWVFGSGSGR